MPKNIGGYIGISSLPDNNFLNGSFSLAGVWNMVHQNYMINMQRWARNAGLTATGNVIYSSDGAYNYYTFTGPGSVTTLKSLTVEVLMVGAGGGGGTYVPAAGNSGAGAGAGGLIYVPTMPLANATTYPISVGAGGVRAPSPSGAWTGTNGGNSTFNGFTALGGGYGAGYFSSGNPGGSGGSGGPGAGTATQPSQPQPAIPYLQYGNPGITGNLYAGTYAGGGGAGAAGGTPGFYDGGVGRQYPQFAGPLIGIPAIVPAPQNGYFAGGGGGTLYTNSGGPYSGGLGGGGGNPVSGGFNPAGQPAPVSPLALDTFFNALQNTGGGGAGGINGYWTGNGGSGIVIIREFVN